MSIFFALLFYINFHIFTHIILHFSVSNCKTEMEASAVRMTAADLQLELEGKVGAPLIPKEWQILE